jgi:hypothetical protein
LGGSTRAVNIFTTDHPMSSRESQIHPLLRSAAIASLVAVVLTPFSLVQLYEFAMRNIGAEPLPFPDRWLAFGVASAVSFAASFACAFIVVLVCRRVARSFVA